MDTGTNNTIIILASARRNSDTEKFLDITFADIECTKINLLDYVISPYDYENKYPPGDNYLDLIKKILEYKNIVYATPVYWYSMSALMKIFFDRFTDIVTVHKQTGRLLAGKSTWLFAVGADPELPPGFEVPFSLTASYLNMEYKEELYYSTKHSQEGILEKTTSFINQFR